MNPYDEIVDPVDEIKVTPKMEASLREKIIGEAIMDCVLTVNGRPIKQTGAQFQVDDSKVETLKQLIRDNDNKNKS